MNQCQAAQQLQRRLGPFLIPETPEESSQSVDAERVESLKLNAQPSDSSDLVASVARKDSEFVKNNQHEFHTQSNRADLTHQQPYALSHDHQNSYSIISRSFNEYNSSSATEEDLPFMEFLSKNKKEIDGDSHLEQSSFHESEQLQERLAMVFVPPASHLLFKFKIGACSTLVEIATSE